MKDESELGEAEIGKALGAATGLLVGRMGVAVGE